MNRFSGLTDEQLEDRLKGLRMEERANLEQFLRHLAEFDKRSVAERRAYGSLWSYCRRALAYSEGEAWTRIQAARAADICEAAYAYLADGRIHLSGLAKLHSVMTAENGLGLLERCREKSYREIEDIVAYMAPKPLKRDHIQTLGPSTPPTTTAPAPAAELAFTPQEPQPLQPRTPTVEQDIRIHFGFTGNTELRGKIDRAKQLLWHKFPQGHLEDIIGAALDDLLDKRDPSRRTEAPRTPKLSPKAEEAHKRYIPLWVRADVWKRDGGRCAYTTSDGVRCEERSALEYDHKTPWALGGPSDEPDNIRLLCRAHNQLLARETFGDAAAGRAAS